MAFEALLEAQLPQGEVREAIDALLVIKRASAEVAAAPRIAALNDWIEAELARMEGAPPTRMDADQRRPDLERIDMWFREVLDPAAG